jgi:acyl carrier protein
MASTGDRLRTLIADNLEIDGQQIDVPEDLNISLLAAGVSSVDLVAFAKLVAKDFDVTFTLEHCTSLNSVKEVADFIDSQPG